MDYPIGNQWCLQISEHFVSLSFDIVTLKSPTSLQLANAIPLQVWADWSRTLFSESSHHRGHNPYLFETTPMGFPSLETLTLDFIEWQLADDEAILVIMPFHRMSIYQRADSWISQVKPIVRTLKSFPKLTRLVVKGISHKDTLEKLRAGFSRHGNVLQIDEWNGRSLREYTKEQNFTHMGFFYMCLWWMHVNFLMGLYGFAQWATNCIERVVRCPSLNDCFVSSQRTPLSLGFDVVSIMQLVMSYSRYPKAVGFCDAILQFGKLSWNGKQKQF